jgi:hypothetical protein
MRVRLLGGKRFESGKARVCAVAYASRRHMADEKSWCVHVSVSPRF